jgi:alkylhydroperoxidase/carboxymuconolactone decarboxylase family protein YurZ
LTKHFAVAKQAGATDDELREAMAYGVIGPAGRAKNFVLRTLSQLDDTI